MLLKNNEMSMASLFRNEKVTILKVKRKGTVMMRLNMGKEETEVTRKGKSFSMLKKYGILVLK